MGCRNAEVSLIVATSLYYRACKWLQELQGLAEEYLFQIPRLDDSSSRLDYPIPPYSRELKLYSKIKILFSHFSLKKIETAKLITVSMRF
jgi:hypothetical protein